MTRLQRHRRPLLVLILALTFLLGTHFAASAADNCQLVRVASLDFTLDPTGRVVVPATIDNHPLDMLVDTGGVLTMLSEEKADALGLGHESAWDSHVRMFGGETVRRYVDVKDFKIGGVGVDHAQFLLLPQNHFPPGVDGLIAPDLLYNFDADFDFGNAKLNFFSPEHCEGRVVYWTNDTAIAVLPITLDAVHHIVIPVTLDGKAVRATLDTGSPSTILSLDEAEELFGLSENAPGMTRRATAALGANAFFYHYPFKTLDLNGVVVDNPDIVLMPDSVSHFPMRGPKMLVGMNVLHALHLYVAYHERTLTVTAADAH